MVSWWVTDSYLNNELIKIGDIEIITSAYGSSGLFRSRVGSKSIGNNTYTGRRSNLRSKPTPIHGKVQKSDFNYSYSICYFSRLTQAFAKKRIFGFSYKFSYSSKIIDLVINAFSPNDESIHLHIYYHSIVIFGIK